MNEKNITKKAYTTPTLTTHGDVAKLTLCETEPSACHSHLPTIPCAPIKIGKGCR